MGVGDAHDVGVEDVDGGDTGVPSPPLSKETELRLSSGDTRYRFDRALSVLSPNEWLCDRVMPLSGIIVKYIYY